MTRGRFNELLDDLERGLLTDEQQAELMRYLRIIEKDSDRSPGERVAAIVLRASLEARRVHA